MDFMCTFYVNKKKKQDFYCAVSLTKSISPTALYNETN